LNVELHNISLLSNTCNQTNSSNCQLNKSIPIWEQEVSRLLEHPYLERLIGVNMSQFNGYLKSVWEILPFLNAKGDYRVNSTSREITRSDKVHLFLTLHWLRQYPTVVNFETILGIPSWAFSHLINRTLVALDSTLEDTATWPLTTSLVKSFGNLEMFFPLSLDNLLSLWIGQKLESPDRKTPLLKEPLIQ
jgi:hypothetical protein